jgi:hypothetical protein
MCSSSATLQPLTVRHSHHAWSAAWYPVAEVASMSRVLLHQGTSSGRGVPTPPLC